MTLLSSTGKTLSAYSPFSSLISPPIPHSNQDIELKNYRFSTRANGNLIEESSHELRPLWPQGDFDAIAQNATLWAEELSLLSYNAWGIPRHLGGASKKRYPIMANELRNCDSSIILLQEAWSKTLHSLLLDNPIRPYHAGSCGAGKLYKGHGLVTLSAFPIVQEEHLEFEQSAGIEKHCMKGALYTKLQLSNDRYVDVYNVHMLSTTTILPEHLAMPVREQQIQQLKSWIEQRTQPNTPIIIAGDFNVHHEGTQYDSLCLHFGTDVYRRRNSVDVCGREITQKRENGFTFDPATNHWAKSFWASRGNPEPRRLDYIFLDNIEGIHPLASCELCFEEPVFRGRTLSDHFALKMKLKLLTNMPFRI